jgi:hypothetical protein
MKSMRFLYHKKKGSSIMSGEARREKLVEILQHSDTVMSGEKLSSLLHVSRQVIVQDISLLRAANVEILSTTRGYYIESEKKPYAERVFKVFHEENQIMQEMNLVVDLGGCLVDVFVYHKVYGVVKAQMNVRSRRDAQEYLNEIEAGKSKPLLHLTSGYHYHTVRAESEQVLDLIQEELKKQGFLAQLLQHEPVDFWEIGEEKKLLNE